MACEHITEDPRERLRPISASGDQRSAPPYRLLFDQLPCGVLAFDVHGRLLTVNLRARAMLGPAVDRPGATCCHLLGCGQRNGALADHCITRLALAQPGPLPEVRIEPELEGLRTASMWVIAAAVGPPSGVVVQLRPGAVGDRRRRTEPHWTGGPTLRILTLGTTRVETSEGPLPGDWLGHRPGKVLKYLLAARGRSVPLDELLEAFWPGAPRAGPAHVRQAVHTLRDRLEPRRSKHRPSSFVIARRSGYELDLTRVWIDADAFDADVRAGVRAIATGDPDAESLLARALALYDGDFLADEPYADWALAERERLRDEATKALRGLASLRRARADLDGAMEALRRMAELEPLDLEVQRDVLALMLRRGRHAEAARRLAVVRRRYRDIFGTDPPLDVAGINGAH